MGWDAFGNYPGISSIKAKTPTIRLTSTNWYYIHQLLD